MKTFSGLLGSRSFLGPSLGWGEEMSPLGVADVGCTITPGCSIFSSRFLHSAQDTKG